MSTRRNLWRDISSTYHSAEEKGAIYRILTRPKLVQDQDLGLGFVLQISEALRDKPKSLEKHLEGLKKKPQDAFEIRDENLSVMDELSGTHMLRLNRYNVVPYHSLVITREFEPQSSLLTDADWQATWETMEAYPEGSIAYFNSGEQSGASQPRKHLQILPLRHNGSATAPLPFTQYVLAACREAETSHLQAAEIRQLPFQAFAATLPQRVGGSGLAKAYCSLLGAWEGAGRGGPYNVLATGEWMMLVPRKQEKCGPISCNALVFAGTMLVRSQAELSYLQDRGPMAILQEVTLPWS